MRDMCKFVAACILLGLAILFAQHERRAAMPRAAETAPYCVVPWGMAWPCKYVQKFSNA